MSEQGSTGDVKRAFGAKQVVGITLGFGIPMGLLFYWQSGEPLDAIIGGLVAGGVFGGVMLYISSRVGSGGEGEREWFGDMQPFDEDEQVLREGLANHFKGVEGVGGKLYLTNRRVRFISHKVNIQTHDESYPLDTIASVEATRTLGIIPNGLRLTRHDGSRERFVVYQRKAWVEALRKAQGQH